MDSGTLFALVYVTVPVVFLVLIVFSRRARRHGGTLRAGVIGATYEWQNRDKQKALEIIVEGKAHRATSGVPGWGSAAVGIAEAESLQVMLPRRAAARQ